MKTASVAEMKARLSEYLKASAASPVVVTRNGKAVAVLVGVIDDEELERVLQVRSRKLSAVLEAAERRIDRGEGIPRDEFWRSIEAPGRAEVAAGGEKKRRAKRRG